jgi:DNA primase
MFFGEHLLRDEPVVVCEGPFDAINVRQAGFNAVAVMGAKYSPEQKNKLVQFGQPVTIFFDNDETGTTQADLLYYELKEAGIEVRYIVPPDPERDAGDYSSEELQKLLAPPSRSKLRAAMSGRPGWE